MLARLHATSAPSASSFSCSDPSDVKDGGTVARTPGAQRMMMYASHLRVESSPRHTRSVAASPAIWTAAVVIVHRKEVVKHQRNGAHDRIGAATGVSFEERRLAEDTVPPMHPDRRWARAVGGTAHQNASKSSAIWHSCVALFLLNRY